MNNNSHDWKKRLRTASELIGTQGQAASVAGVSLRQFSKYLAGDAQAPTKVLSKISEVSGKSLDWLINGDGNDESEPPAQDDSLSAASTEELEANREPWVERLREVVGKLVSHLKAAEVAKTSPRQFRKYVSGETKPSAQAWVNLAHAADYSLEWLITGAGPKKYVGKHAQNKKRLLKLATTSPQAARDAVTTLERLAKVEEFKRELRPELAEVYGDIPGEQIDALVDNVFVVLSDWEEDDWPQVKQVIIGAHMMAKLAVVDELIGDEEIAD